MRQRTTNTVTKLSLSVRFPPKTLKQKLHFFPKYEVPSHWAQSGSEISASGQFHNGSVTPAFCPLWFVQPTSYGKQRKNNKDSQLKERGMRHARPIKTNGLPLPEPASEGVRLWISVFTSERATRSLHLMPCNRKGPLTRTLRKPPMTKCFLG